MKSVDQMVQNALLDRSEKGLFRTLAKSGSMIDFSSNDYLGLASSGSVFEDQGSGGSRLLSCKSEIAIETESMLSEFHNCESALVFGSGYSANLGTLSAFAMRDLTVIYDELSHASIRDGMRLGKSTTWKFKHNDLKDLEEKIKKAATPVLVVTESVFSMDGDSPDFDRLLELKKLYKFALFVDEAHGFGWVESGQTRTEQLGIAEHIEARTVTFGKALGAHGAAVLCSENWKAFLVNFARPFIYSTGPSSSFYHRIGEQYLKIKGADEERKSLSSNMAYFLSRKKKSRLKMIVSASPIQGVIGNEVQVRGWEQKLLENGVSAKKILSPTVATGKERIRICLHSFNTKEEIDLLFNLLEDESH